MSSRLYLKAEHQVSRSRSSWTVKEAVLIRIWDVLWLVFLRWTPKGLNCLRLWVLRLFGAKIEGRPFVFPSAWIYAPFNLEIHDGACIGPRTDIYNLGKVVLRERSVVSKETMLCGGTHDLSSHRLPLLVGDIELGKEVFVGVRALVLPGIKVDDGAVIGAGAVVTKDVDPWTVVGGNPAKFLKKRELNHD